MLNHFNFVRRLFVITVIVATLGASLQLYTSNKVYAERLVNVSNTEELTEAIAEAVSGDTIVLADGTYSAEEYIHIQDKHGTANDPIRIVALNQGKAVIAGDLWFKVEDSSYIIIDGLTFTTNGNVGNKAVYLLNTEYCRITNSHFVLNESVSATNSLEWVLIEGDQSGYNRVDHSLFENKKQRGQFVTIKGSVTASVYNQIDHNRFRDMRITGENGTEAVKLGNGSNGNWSYAYTLLEHNLFERCDGEEAEMISIKSGGNIIRYNTIVETAGGIVFRRGNGNEAYGNYFFGNGKTNTAGIRIHGEDHQVYNNYFEGLGGVSSRAAMVIGTGASDGSYNPVRNVLVANNTFVENRRSLHIALDGDLANRTLPEDTVISNNIVYASGSSKRLVTEVVYSPDVVWEGNIMYEANSAVLGASKTSGE
ncbi:MAG: lyase, partial [Paenibacillus sp.]|nr:lyase [Paenibacillus sp.]